MNGDGFGDVIVGTLAYNGTFAGGANLYLGGPDGLSMPVAIVAPSSAAEFADSVACAGDVNGDGYADVIVGAIGVGGSAASVYVFVGDAGGLSANPVALPAALVPSSFAEFVASAGDVDADGFSDVIVAVNQTYGGAGDVYLYRGGAAGFAAMPIVFPITSQSETRVAVAGAGDVNGDGFADFLIGTILPDGVNLYYGSAGGPGAPTPVLDQYPDGLYKALFGSAVQ